ncbi:hypothetical protein ACWEN3_35900, partial [Streptomyces sp. NPDC004561]
PHGLGTVQAVRTSERHRMRMRLLAAVDRWAALQEAEGGTDTGAPGLVTRAVDALLGVAL